MAAYDFVEMSQGVSGPLARNPFTDLAVTGWFALAGASSVKLDGFCDSSDGTLFRIRLIPPKPDNAYTLKYAQQGVERSHEETFHATISCHR